MITYYTAIGGFEGGAGIKGSRRPVLLKAGCKYDVTLPQFVLWSSLLWNIRRYDEIKAVYNIKMAETRLQRYPSFSITLNDMLDRGLIASGRGGTATEALNKLLEELILVPVHTSFWERLCGFFYLAFIRRLPLRIAVRLLGKPPLSQQEQAVWALISRRAISTAELIRHNEHTRFADRGFAVISAVANLYLKKLILFE